MIFKLVFIRGVWPHELPKVVEAELRRRRRDTRDLILYDGRDLGSIVRKEDQEAKSRKKTGGEERGRKGEGER